jgi:hypothetical protein
MGERGVGGGIVIIEFVAFIGFVEFIGFIGLKNWGRVDNRPHIH